jgi:hypothetical protein
MTRIMKFALLAALPLLTSAPLAAQSAGEPPFRVFGYVTQGLGAAGEIPIAGLPTTGTTDIRSVALQARYRVDDASVVVVQFSHRRVGESPMGSLEPSVDLAWAFYRRSLGPVSMSVGRLPIPRGFYNEIRNVGTLLPMFRAPLTIYPDGTEAVDGVAATTRTELGRWSIESSAYMGGTEWKGAMSDGQQLFGYAARSEVSAGAQVWLATPIDGVRAGASYLNFVDVLDEDERANAWIASAEVDRDRWMVRTELSDISLKDYQVRAGYVHGRFLITPRFQVMGQYERSDIHMFAPIEAEWTDMKDGAVGIAYSPSTSVIFKLEGHRAEGFAFDVPIESTGPAGTSDYAILSMSVSF